MTSQDKPAVDVEALERLAKEATGKDKSTPWLSEDGWEGAESTVSSGRYMVAMAYDAVDGVSSEDIAAFIAAANPAAVLELIAMARRTAAAEGALEEIAASHVPDQPAESDGNDLAWALRHVATLRRIASRALTGAKS
jgi:hypothetical protein